MGRIDVEFRCRKKAEELIEKYFPNFIRESAISKPEMLALEYNDDLPHRVEAEFRGWLSDLWAEIAPDGSKQFEEIMNLHLSMSMVDASYIPHLKDARENAVRITLWEKITKSNHEDVTYYKGLLKQYTEEQLNTMIKDFLGDVDE